MVTVALSLFVLDCKCNKVRKNAEVRAVTAHSHQDTTWEVLSGPFGLSLVPSALHISLSDALRRHISSVFTKVLFLNMK